MNLGDCSAALRYREFACHHVAKPNYGINRTRESAPLLSSQVTASRLDTVLNVKRFVCAADHKAYLF